MSVVLGRFQDANREVDLTHCESAGVYVVRRFTGGGTVFHDEATLNFTLLRSRPEGSTLRFQEMNLRLVAEALSSLGASCSVSPPNSILIEGRKVCGAAAALGKGFTLWHCSILVNTNLESLERALAPSKSEGRSTFVRSKWQQVTTLANAITRPITVHNVAESLDKAIEKKPGVELLDGRLTNEEEENAEALYAQKYSKDEWNMRGNLGFSGPKRLDAHTTIAV
jgi:lipoate-protein ligase A